MNMWQRLLDDLEIILELRRMNAKPSSTIFDQFWDELRSCFHETTLAVDERRHLLELITEQLKSKHPDSTVGISSQDWPRLQL